jgi:chromosome segregation ATPase
MPLNNATSPFDKEKLRKEAEAETKRANIAAAKRAEDDKHKKKFALEAEMRQIADQLRREETRAEATAREIEQFRRESARISAEKLNKKSEVAAGERQVASFDVNIKRLEQDLRSLETEERTLEAKAVHEGTAGENKIRQEIAQETTAENNLKMEIERLEKELLQKKKELLDIDRKITSQKSQKAAGQQGGGMATKRKIAMIKQEEEDVTNKLASLRAQERNVEGSADRIGQEESKEEREIALLKTKMLHREGELAKSTREIALLKQKLEQLKREVQAI